MVKNKSLVKFTVGFDFGLTILFVDVTAEVTLNDGDFKIEILSIYAVDLEMNISQKMVEDKILRHIEMISILVGGSQ